jgi:hypothetical protein
MCKRQVREYPLQRKLGLCQEFGRYVNLELLEAKQCNTCSTCGVRLLVGKYSVEAPYPFNHET